MVCTHIDLNIDMICDTCKGGLPFEDYVENKTLEVASVDNTLATISGKMPKDTKAIIASISKDEAFSLAQKYMNVSREDVLYAYDISLDTPTMEYQPAEYSQTVEVELSNIELDLNKEYVMLHIMDNNKHEIIPVDKISNNKISFNATSFSTYILITVEGHTITFTGANYKVYDIEGNEITDGATIASGTDFRFTIDPTDEYGVTAVTCVNSSSESVVTVSGYVKMRTGIISSVTEDLTIDVTTAIAPSITVQPVSTKVKTGSSASFKLTAQNATTYQWQYKDSDDAYWTNTSTSATLSVTASHNISGRKYRCLVGNANFTAHERVVSDIVQIWVTDDEIIEQATIINDTGLLPPVITEQPVSAKVKIGSSAKFTIKAENATTYQWQYRDSRDVYWTNLSSTSSSSGTATLTVTATEAVSGREYRCLVGNSGFVLHSRPKSDIFLISVADDDTTEPVTYYNIEITSQPESQKIKMGETATFAIQETGSNKYQWQYKTSSDATEWIDVDGTLGTSSTIASGYTTKTLKINTSNMSLDEETLTDTNGLSGYVFRCVVTSSSLSRVFENSDTAYLSVAQDDILQDNIKIKTPSTLELKQTAVFVEVGGSKEISFEYVGDGALSVESSDRATATATIDGNVITVNGLQAGNVTLTVQASAGEEYGSNTKTINVTVVDTAKMLVTEWTIPSSVTVQLPIPLATTNSYTVDWGDGKTEFFDNTADFPSHEYEAGTYTIKIAGTVSQFGYIGNATVTSTNTYKDYYGFTQYVTKLVNWGEIEATKYGFAQCINLAGTIPVPIENSFKNITSFEYLFYNCAKITSIPNDMFSGATNLSSYSTADGLYRAFSNCSALTSININTNYIGSQMFYACNSLTDITIGDNVENIGANAFYASSPYSLTNPLVTTLNTTNQIALNYDWLNDNRADEKSITAEPSDVTTEANKEVTFSVVAEGDNLSYQWYEIVGGVATELTLGGTHGYSGVNTSTLTIPADKVTEELSENQYYCKVFNSFGEVTTREATLTVIKDISAVTVSFDKASYEYTGTSIEPKVTISLDEENLVEGTNYTIAYNNNVNTGTATAIITGKGIYAGTKEETFTINPKSVAVVWANTTLTYTGSAQVPTATANTGVNGETIVLTVSGAQTNVGNNYTATASIASVTGGQAKVENYTLTNTTVTFKILVDTNTTFDNTLSSTTHTYDGNEVEPEVTVKVGDKTLVEGTDYEVTYENNTDAGTGTVIITGIGNYEGIEATEEFTIEKMTLIITPNAGQSKVFGESDPKTLEYTYSGNIIGEIPNFTGALARAKGESAGTYAINLGTLEVADSDTLKASNYKLALDSAVVNFTIMGKDISGANVTLDVSTFSYDGTEKEPGATITLDGKTLTEGTDYEITYEDNINVGTATVIITGINDYTGNVEVTFTITSIPLNVTAVNYEGIYDGKEHGITLDGSELSGATIAYGTTMGNYNLPEAPTYINAGEYTIYFKVSKQNYDDYIGSAKVIIERKPVKIVWSNLELTYNGQAQTPTATIDSGIPGETIKLKITGEGIDMGTYTATAKLESVEGGQGNINNYVLEKNDNALNN